MFHPDLDTGLRYHAAADLHRWVGLVLEERRLGEARQLARRLRLEAFPIYVTLAVVCWGDDFWWDGGESRWGGREGTVIFVPPSPAARMDATFKALLGAGAVEAGAVPG